MSKKHYIIPIFVPHEGCPFDCVFCNQRKITGVDTTISYRDVENIIENHIRTIGVSYDKHIEVAFFGGSFTGINIEKQRELLSAADKWYKRGVIKDIRLSTRPDYIDEKILENLKKFNVSIIELGVQSLDNDVLKQSFRGHSAEDVIAASKLIKKFDFKLGLQMMIGLPGDNIQKSVKTANRIVSCNPNFVRIYPTLVIKGTNLEKMYLKGIYNPLTLNEAVEICKELYKIFSKNNIKVIRMGLQPTDNIMEGKDVVAGPFHPSFRQLVISSLIRDKIVDVLSKYEKKVRELIFIVNSKNISFVVGNKKENINYIKEKFNIGSIKIKEDNSILKDIIKLSLNNNDTFTIKFQ
ncbi:hypothetical protein SAMN02745883_00184 [Caminicella sporogenes DSM 14501]|uniref:Radical SAM core domain-containing protein n=1 Tax=Caminicella sporogenes DSM 14501 TaxID=1121266 RepID=A0A1M6LF06_9FIRM|nr:radical SAM protein [Caminicella sporogenes]RKD27813.1 radical SAM protein [Caminicella sporogenes]WIF94612.1 radical SAM protein [Caminicella sporogenes]SHJ69784.1 hypothetical protein SAMN02745883_00184 [Caminicella sporogenes DSM 14501]